MASHYNHPLHELVATTMAAKGYDSPTVAARSGGLVSRQNVDLHRNGIELRIGLQPKTIEGLARGLGLPRDRVRAAAQESVGGAAPALDADTRAVVALMRAATSGQRRRWRRLVEAAAAREDVA